ERNGGLRHGDRVIESPQAIQRAAQIVSRADQGKFLTRDVSEQTILLEENGGGLAEPLITKGDTANQVLPQRAQPRRVWRAFKLTHLFQGTGDRCGLVRVTQ